MSYGKFVNAGLLVREIPAEGYKPIVKTAPETPDGYRAVSHYEETGESIVTVWEYIELTAEEKAEIEAHGIDNAEAFAIIFGGDAE
jgi:hypothetical protein